MPSGLKLKDPGAFRVLRCDRHLTKHALADASGVSAMTLFRAERGQAITEDNAFAIAGALEIPVSELFLVADDAA